MASAMEEGGLGPLRDTEDIVLGLYHHLWVKDPHGQSCQVNIPHTVLYQNSNPVAWYFTSLKASTIMRKKRSNLEGPGLAEAFLSGRESKPEVCAWFSGRMTQLQSSARKLHSSSDNGRDSEELAMEYLTHDRLQSMIVSRSDHSNPEQMFDGVLQKFVEPRDSNDCIFRVVWSPTSSTLEKRVNRHRLDGSDGTPMPDRIAAFRGSPSHHQDLPVVEGVLQTRLQAQCAAVAKHIKDVTRGQTLIARMEVFFKIDAHNRIWLLYCSSLQLEVVPPLRVVYNREVQGGAFVLKDPTRSEQVQAEQEDKATFSCAVTGRVLPGSKRSQVTFQLLMQQWFKRCSELPSEAERIQAMDTIPPALRRANPNMSRDYYLRNRSQPFFLSNMADVGPDAIRELEMVANADLAGSLATPWAAKLRPASASTILASGAPSPSGYAASPGRTGDGVGRARPLSCSALSRSKEQTGSQHWHRRITGTPSGATGAIVTPHTTGRVRSASPARAARPPLFRQPQSTTPSAPQSPAAPSTAARGVTLPGMLQPKVEEGYAQLQAHILRAMIGSQGGQGLGTRNTPPRPSTKPTTLHSTQGPAPGGAEWQYGAHSPEASSRLSGRLSAPALGRATGLPSQATPGSARHQQQEQQQQQQQAVGVATSLASSASTSGQSPPALPQALLPSQKPPRDALSNTAALTARRSGPPQPSGGEARTLKELSDAYTEAEQLTKALLTQAEHLLQAPTSGQPLPPPTPPLSGRSALTQADLQASAMAGVRTPDVSLTGSVYSFGGSVHLSYSGAPVQAGEGHRGSGAAGSSDNLGPSGQQLPLQRLGSARGQHLPPQPRPFSAAKSSASGARPVSARPPAALASPGTLHGSSSAGSLGASSGARMGAHARAVSVQALIAGGATAPMTLTAEEEAFLSETVAEPVF